MKPEKVMRTSCSFVLLFIDMPVPTDGLLFRGRLNRKSPLLCSGIAGNPFSDNRNLESAIVYKNNLLLGDDAVAYYAENQNSAMNKYSMAQ